MLQIVNATPFAAERAVVYNAAGDHIWVVVIKATYRVEPDGSIELADAQEPVTRAPEYFGEAGASTLRRDAELVYAHPGTAVIVNASAHAPDGAPVRRLDVGVEVGPLAQRLRVFGSRRWERRFTGVRSSEPEPFARVPLRYEQAFGGVCADDDSVYEPNPVGCGYYANAASAVDRPLPQVEAPASLIRSWRDRPPPAGWAAIPPAWAARKRLAGTADEQWMRTRAPLVPDDFQPAFFNAGAPGMRTDAPLVGGERAVLSHLAPQARLAFTLPRVFFNIQSYLGKQRVRQDVQLDRVMLEPDDARLILVWRSTLNCGRDARIVDVTHIDTKRHAYDRTRFGI